MNEARVTRVPTAKPPESVRLNRLNRLLVLPNSFSRQRDAATAQALAQIEKAQRQAALEAEQKVPEMHDTRHEKLPKTFDEEATDVRAAPSSVKFT